MEYALGWWVAVEVLGLLALPYLFWTFPFLPDRGFAFAKPLGSLLLGYVLWVLGTAHLLPNGRGTALLACVLVGLGGLWLARRQATALMAFLRQARGTLLVYEAVFFVAFFLWALVRAYNPQIEGTEKPMDFAMLNTSMLSTSFPPQDPWLNGYSVSYYYFGYLIMGGLTYLSGVPPTVGYNLALAFLFAATAVGVWGLVASATTLLSKTPKALPLPRARHFFGALGAFLVVGLGNLVGVLELVRAHGGGNQGLWTWLALKKETDPATSLWRLLGVAPYDASYQSSIWYPNEPWWWWRSTRVIDTVVDGTSYDYTITEFPAFSFLLGDMHPHVMALPFAVLALALVLHTLVRPKPASERAPEQWLHMLLPFSFVLGGLGFINGWDLAPYFALIFGTVALRAGWLQPTRRSLTFLAASGGMLLGGVLLLYAPFYLSLGMHVVGTLAQGQEGTAVRGFPLAWWPGPGTRPAHFLLLWAPLLSLAGVLLVVVARQGAPSLRVLISGAAGAMILSWAILEVVRGGGAAATELPITISVLQRVWPFFPVAALLAWLWPLATSHEEEHALWPLAFPVLLAGSAFLLLGFAESFYIKDVFGNRMNTVFKFSYQAWLWLSVAGALTAYLVWQTGPVLMGRGWRIAWTSAAAALLVACGLYLPAAVLSKTEAFHGPATLDGQAYLQTREPQELEALRWLQRQGDRRNGSVLEATGPQYSPYARVSASTGIPTVLGWAGHELQWRGSDAAYKGRAEDIDSIYQAADKAQVAPLLIKYRVRFVYVGSLERAKYPPEALATFQNTFPVAFQNSGVTIYKVPEL